MAQNERLAALSGAGVSVWLDDLSRERIESGNLADLVATHSVVGVTTNPSIFQAAMSKGTAYAGALKELAGQGADADAAVRAMTTDDVRNACDILAPVFNATDGLDGRVSIEVDPRLAHDTEATIAQAKTLWQLVDRPNVMIKIPATLEGIPAIAATLAEGISVNVTLIFSVQRYEMVANAYLDGLAAAKANGHDLSKIRSVASLFVSRVDTEVDNRLDAIGGDVAASLRGKAGLANSRLTYEAYQRVFEEQPWFQALAKAGAHPQRVLWASTGTKNAAYPDTLYIEGLVAPNTVNTMPEKTMDAYADHGDVAVDTVSGTYGAERTIVDQLIAAGVDFAEVFRVLEAEGVDKFEVAWNELLTATTAALNAASAS